MTFSGFESTVGKADAALDERLNDELDRFNAAANPHVPPAEELTVRVQAGGELVAGARLLPAPRLRGDLPLGVRSDPGRDDVHMRKEL